MFGSEYYCLVAGLRDYALDADTKGFDARAIIDEVLAGVSSRDARAVRLLYGYYDCENLVARRAGREAFNPLGNLSREELAEELKQPHRLPSRVANVVRAYADPEGEEAEEMNLERRFEQSIFEAYYAECAASSSRFLRAWSLFDRNLRNLTAAVAARAAGRAIEEVVVGDGEVVDQLRRSSAADFGLRGELPWIDAVIAAVNEEPNLVEKEHKIDVVRWNESVALTAFDYFNIDALMAYLVRVNLVARWARLDVRRGREMFGRLMSELEGKEWINKQ